MNNLSNLQLQELQCMLLEEKTELERRFELNGNFGLSEPIRPTLELSTYDNHPGDIGTELFERSKDLALNERAEMRLDAVSDALLRMKEGDYGTCSICGKPIPYERLKAVPETAYCIDHARDQDVSNERPVEEEILSPPFGRTSLDELETSQNQFDGEDAWQIVESWGNSSSPAFSEDPEVHDYNEMFIENDEKDGYVEQFESFLATDIYGEKVMVVRNAAYKEYMEAGNGEPLLEPDTNESLDG